jgi:transcription elongation GreA/GreB family factor
VPETAPAPATPRGGVTSWRSYRQRQRQLEKLVNEDIPANSRDIGHARSYGDLSENFEYKAAKEQQRILMHRQEELEAQLKSVTGTDFAGLPAEAAGIGTRVVLEYPDGRRTEHCILGEWDQDEALGIIACSSRMSQALTGHKAGDEVRVPAEHGEEACRLAEVAPLPETVRAWCRGA